MPTIKQLMRNTRQPIRNVTISPALRGCPQRRGTCTRVYVRVAKAIGIFFLYIGIIRLVIND
ncbi:unnamed protein product [Brassica oleracea]|uniref:(rape) hypothetical protein n=1 Tax=Brassica napus TaxID=3708 RepID=A0A816KAT5_BRANA|nr:unnamed protein product [Brassica napus]